MIFAIGCSKCEPSSRRCDIAPFDTFYIARTGLGGADQVFRISVIGESGAPRLESRLPGIPARPLGIGGQEPVEGVITRRRVERQRLPRSLERPHGFHDMPDAATPEGIDGQPRRLCRSFPHALRVAAPLEPAIASGPTRAGGAAQVDRNLRR